MIRFTSTRNSPFYIRADCLVMIEGFTYAADHKLVPNHEGAIVTILGKWGSESAYILETPEEAHAIWQAANGAAP